MAEILADSHPAAGLVDHDDLIAQIQDLRQRVENLENRLAIPVAPQVLPVPAVSAVPPASDFVLPTNIVPVLGRMLVGIAGAYVLRALTDWGALPTGAGVTIGLLYAFLWLWIAARSPADAKFAAAVGCSTSVLIMAPLLWEATGRLKVMTTGMSAGVLAGFALVALVLGMKARHGIIATIGAASSIVMAIAFLFDRNDVVPFTAALLIIAAAMEFAAWRDLPAGARAFAAIGADSAVLLFSYLMARPRGMPEAWVPASPYFVLAAQMAVVLIYSASAVIQTVVRRRTLTLAEIARTTTALLAGFGGAVWVFKDNRAIVLELGIVALAGGVACYAVSFLFFERHNKQNFRALATFGLFLVLTGFFLPFSSSGFWILSCACAIACCWAARTLHLPTLGLHGAIYLLLGAAVARVTGQPLQVLFGVGTTTVNWAASMAVLLAAVVCWVAIAGVSSGDAGRWRNQISSLAIAAHIAWIMVGLTVFAVLGVSPATVPADTLGTVVLIALSLGLAWAGTHWGRRELVWLLYGFMAIGAYKLATRDFMNERNLPLVVSLLCYGGALIMLPRMLRAESSTEDR